ncbi:hypothetical protein FQA39_LY13856 [Lamprigera yunnana]|nr:hypothetical protein FQA39_LY13856 [Lamprigera yunnana]
MNSTSTSTGTSELSTIHRIEEKLFQITIVFEIIKMYKSTFICIDYVKGFNFADVSLVIYNHTYLPSPRSKETDPVEMFRKEMANKISEKIQKNVYFSCNINYNKNVFALVEERLFKEIKDRPEKFY